MQLEIDEHSADAGIITRLEAFLDSIKNARVESRVIKSKAPRFGVDGNRRKIYIPYMSDHAFTLSSAFKACGVDAELMEESDEKTVYLGRKFTTGKECYPCILTTGDMVKCTRKETFDPARSAFFMLSGSGPCRFGQYHRFHRIVLDEMGFKDVPIYAPNQDDRFYKEFNIMGGKFSRLGWRAVVAVDLIVKMLHEIRPYEENKGETDRIYKESLLRISETLEKDGDRIIGVLEDIVKRFLNIKRLSLIHI